MAYLTTIWWIPLRSTFAETTKRNAFYHIWGFIIILGFCYAEKYTTKMLSNETLSHMQCYGTVNLLIMMAGNANANGDVAAAAVDAVL